MEVGHLKIIRPLALLEMIRRMNSGPLPEIWLAVGSQDLYGDETLARVAEDAAVVAGALDADTAVPVRVVPTPVLCDSSSMNEL